MNVRALMCRFAAACVLAGLAFAAAPASAQSGQVVCSYDRYGRTYCHHLGLIAPQPAPYYAAGCGGCGGVAVQPVVPQYYASPCGGCGTYYTAPQPQYYSSCGGCGTYYTAPQPVIQPQYYSVPCGNCQTAYTAPAPAPEPELPYVEEPRYRHRHPLSVRN